MTMTSIKKVIRRQCQYFKTEQGVVMLFPPYTCQDGAPHMQNTNLYRVVRPTGTISIFYEVFFFSAG